MVGGFVEPPTVKSLLCAEDAAPCALYVLCGHFRGLKTTDVDEACLNVKLVNSLNLDHGNVSTKRIGLVSTLNKVSVGGELLLHVVNLAEVC